MSCPDNPAKCQYLMGDLVTCMEYLVDGRTTEEAKCAFLHNYDSSTSTITGDKDE